VRALFTRAGVDYDQWKAVSRTLLRSDFRPPGQHTGHYSLRTVGGAALMVITYGLLGLGAAVVVAINRDVLLTGIVTLCYVAVLVTTSLMAQHGSAIASTTDYAILAPQPVSSRTFLAIRLTNVLFHTALLTTLMAYPPILAYILAHGISARRGVAAAAAIYGFALAMTFALVGFYGTLLRVFGAARLQKAVGYAQMLIGILVYGGVVLLMQFVGTRLLAATAMPREPWLLLVPPAWFASYIEIAVGEVDWDVWIRAAFSLVALGALMATLRGPLGTAYAERLGELTASTGTVAAPTRQRHGPLFRRNEPRAVALLVRAQFRHDLRVRLGVLAIVPLTILYMFMGLREGSSGDPFSASGGQAVDLVALAVLFFPTLIVQQFSGSDAYHAAWVYFATPANRPAIVAALKNVIVTFFFLPYVGFLALLFIWRFGHVGHALVHAGFLGLIGYLALQAGAWIEPRLPFALPPKKAVNNAAMIAWMIVAVVGGHLLLFFVIDVVYASWWRVAAGALALVGLSALLDIAIRARALRKYESLEFS
jgi:ABC-2 type transport system permease protein